MPKVKFMPQNVEFEIQPGEHVLDLARRAGLYVKSICNGVPSCAECRVRILEGAHNLMPPSFKEKNLIGSAYFVDGSRLSCQLKPMGDIVVNLEEQIQKQNAPPSDKKPQLPRKYQMMKEQREAEKASTDAARGQSHKPMQPAIFENPIEKPEAPVEAAATPQNPKNPMQGDSQRNTGRQNQQRHHPHNNNQQNNRQQDNQGKPKSNPNPQQSQAGPLNRRPLNKNKKD